jgi:DNA mismatch repair protein MutS2
MDITSGIAKAEQEARKKIDQIFKAASGQRMDGRWLANRARRAPVYPLLAENKRKLKGFIHDESASGQTVYMEPEEVFTLNNRMRDLEFDRRREIIKILTALNRRIAALCAAFIIVPRPANQA